MRIIKEETCAVIIDIQEKLFPVMSNCEQLLDRCSILVQGLKILQIPIIVTEQYPKGLGHTVSALHDILPEKTETIEKTSFSCVGSNQFLSKLNWFNKDNVLVFGIESHVCVLQTVIDLIDAGKTPIVIKDCISSRNISDMDIALLRMQKEGAIISTSESILFELCQKAGTDRFKAISKLVK